MFAAYKSAKIHPLPSKTFRVAGRCSLAQHTHNHDNGMHNDTDVHK